MNLFRRKLKINKEITKKIFSYFKIEKTDKETILLGDFANKDFGHWLCFIHDIVQKAMKEKFIDGSKVENYVNITLHIGGQRVDIALIKDGCKGPHELYREKLGEGL